MNKTDKIFIAGSNGMVGSATVRALKKSGYKNLVLRDIHNLNLLDTVAVQEFYKQEQPNIVVLAAARVGGIKANMEHPAEFLYQNLVIQNNVIHQAYLNNVKKFCFLGSSCIFPKNCPQPMKEEYLLTGPLEPTNEGYALAKISGLRMIEYYRQQYGFPGFSIMPCNLYGTNDSFDLEKAHVLSSLVRKFCDAVSRGDKTVTVWGTGIARREFMHVDDAAAAIVYFMKSYDSPKFINVGWGRDISIKELAEMIVEATGFKGKIVWDKTKPDGMLRKCMDVSRMKHQGFEPQITLQQGISQIIKEYREKMVTA